MYTEVIEKTLEYIKNLLLKGSFDRDVMLIENYILYYQCDCDPLADTNNDSKAEVSRSFLHLPAKTDIFYLELDITNNTCQTKNNWESEKKIRYI